VSISQAICAILQLTRKNISGLLRLTSGLDRDNWLEGMMETMRDLAKVNI
jgi:hypothetical protein